MTTRILSDSFARELRMILDQHGICRDVAFTGEIDRLMERPGIRRRYLRRAGLTVDAIGELVVDRRITDSRPTCREVLDMLETALTPSLPKRGRVRVSRPAVACAEQKARVNRLRKFECSTCHQIARGTRSSMLACGLCFEMRGEVIMLRRVDPLPEEILAMAMEAA